MDNNVAKNTIHLAIGYKIAYLCERFQKLLENGFMPLSLLILVVFSVAAYYAARRYVLVQVGGNKSQLRSLPHFYGWCSALWIAVPAVILLAGVTSWQFKAAWAQPVAVVISALLGVVVSWKVIRPSFRAHNHVERWGRGVLFVAATVSITVTILIVFSVLFEAIRFFQHVPVIDFLFGTVWSPQTALRADQAGSSGAFGAVPVFAGTLLITLIAMAVAVPLGLMSAIYISEYAAARTRAVVKPILEILAGIPTVVYGYFAAITVAPFIRATGVSLGLDVASESALAAGAVMGIMIIPFILSLSDDVMNAVPNALRDASYALGSTKAETISKVVVPAALPGIMGAVLLAVSRAIGETMIVVMAAGLAANMTLNPLKSVTTVTAQIVTLLVGDQEFDSAKTLAAFALGLTLFVVTLLLNILALVIVRKYQEKYD